MMLAGYEQSQGWHADAFAHCSEAQARYFQAEFDALHLSDLHPARVLDIGFGNGAFLGWCRQRRLECEGIEVNDTLIARAQAAGFTAHHGSTSSRQLPAHAPTLVTLFDVLEHVQRDELVPFLRDIATRCSDHTVVLARFPNGDNPFSLPLQNGDVTHVTAIGQAMLRQVAALAGLEVLALRDPVQPLAGVGWRRRLAIGLGQPLRRGIGWVIRHLFMGGVPVSFSPNLVAVMRKLPQKPGLRT